MVKQKVISYSTKYFFQSSSEFKDEIEIRYKPKHIDFQSSSEFKKLIKLNWIVNCIILSILFWV